MIYSFGRHFHTEQLSDAEGLSQSGSLNVPGFKPKRLVQWCWDRCFLSLTSSQSGVDSFLNPIQVNPIRAYGHELGAKSKSSTGCLIVPGFSVDIAP